MLWSSTIWTHTTLTNQSHHTDIAKHHTDIAQHHTDIARCLERNIGWVWWICNRTEHRFILYEIRYYVLDIRPGMIFFRSHGGDPVLANLYTTNHVVCDVCIWRRHDLFLIDSRVYCTFWWNFSEVHTVYFRWNFSEVRTWNIFDGTFQRCGHSLFSKELLEVWIEFCSIT